MKVAMCDPSLFTGRYDDSLCAALAAAGMDVALLGRPMRATDAIAPNGYRYEPRFFRRSEALRLRMGEGQAFRLLKAAEYGLSCMLGDLTPLTGADVAHMQWLPLAPADRIMLRRLKGGTALVHTVHNADAYHADAGVQGRGYRGLLDMFDALIVHGGTTREALERQGVDPRRIHMTPHPPMRLATAGPQDLAQVPDPVLPRLLFFGTIRPYKGVDLLLEACLSLWRAGHGFELVLAGKPFMDIAPLLDSVHAAGFGDRLILDLGFLAEQRLDAHMKKADILVFPYRAYRQQRRFPVGPAPWQGDGHVRRRHVRQPAGGSGRQKPGRQCARPCASPLAPRRKRDHQAGFGRAGADLWRFNGQLEGHGPGHHRHLP